MSTYSNQLQPALQSLLQRVVWFFHARSSCMMHISADVQRIALNAWCMTFSGRRTEQLDVIAGFLPCHWLYRWFSQFHSCGTYSVLSRSPSITLMCPSSCLHNQHADTAGINRYPKQLVAFTVAASLWNYI